MEEVFTQKQLNGSTMKTTRALLVTTLHYTHIKINTLELVDDKNNEANFQSILNYFFKNNPFNKRLHVSKSLLFI